MTSKPQVLLDEVDLVEKIYEITQTMFVTLSEWQAGVTIDWESAKVKGRAELMDLVQSQKIAWAEEVIGSNDKKPSDPVHHNKQYKPTSKPHKCDLPFEECNHIVFLPKFVQIAKDYNGGWNERAVEQRKRNQLNKTERE